MDYIDLIGTPFKYGGRSLKDGGLDCYGVVVEMSRRNGQMMPERQFSESLDMNHALMACQMDEWVECDRGPGAVILIRICKVPCHVGFALDDYQFIHAWEGSGGVVVERIDEWQKRIEGFYRYVGQREGQD